ncbi:hypothetical protein EYF80_029084 [Liparis tanakae]|uniref:Uncharacterized protein n=1 Tax=Liparis tanakae TaxID=230148 RepID=A0A4Z2H5H3_9TELE|nr:hypothetical protein EYF80_029084 [Liparis tanakae]
MQGRKGRKAGKKAKKIGRKEGSKGRKLGKEGGKEGRKECKDARKEGKEGRQEGKEDRKEGRKAGKKARKIARKEGRKGGRKEGRYGRKAVDSVVRSGAGGEQTRGGGMSVAQRGVRATDQRSYFDLVLVPAPGGTLTLLGPLKTQTVELTGHPPLFSEQRFLVLYLDSREDSLVLVLVSVLVYLQLFKPPLLKPWGQLLRTAQEVQEVYMSSLCEISQRPGRGV